MTINPNITNVRHYLLELQFIDGTHSNCVKVNAPHGVVVINQEFPSNVFAIINKHHAIFSHSPTTNLFDYLTFDFRILNFMNYPI
jgi:hypothetical protein